MFQRLEVLRCYFAMDMHPQEQYIKFYQVGVLYCSQACLKNFEIMDYINTRHTRQSKKINFILLYPDKHSQQQQIDTVFSIGYVRHTQSSLSCKFLVFEGYLNFSLWLCWLRQQIVMYLQQPQEIFFISILLTWVQLGPASYLLFISVFGG